MVVAPRPSSCYGFAHAWAFSQYKAPDLWEGASRFVDEELTFAHETLCEYELIGAVECTHPCLTK